jgi:DNA-binding response OmpR family regulator
VEAQPLSGLLQAGPLSIDAGQRQAWLHGQPLTLTSTQYTLVVHLVEHAGQVVAGEDLEKAVWGEAYVEDPERLKSVIKGLRRALGEEAARLENVRGVGYVWRA